MSPKITDGTTVRLTIDRHRHTLLVRMLTPRDARADFVVSSATGGDRDQGLMSTNSSAGVARSKFYVGQPTVTGMAASSNVYIKDSKDRPVVLVQLED